MSGQTRSQPLAVATDALVPGSDTREGKYCSALVVPAAADAILTIYDGPASGNDIVAQLKAVANGPVVGEHLCFPISYSGGPGKNGLHYTLSGAGATCQIGYRR